MSALSTYHSGTWGWSLAFSDQSAVLKLSTMMPFSCLHSIAPPSFSHPSSSQALSASTSQDLEKCMRATPGHSELESSLTLKYFRPVYEGFVGMYHKQKTKPVHTSHQKLQS